MLQAATSVLHGDWIIWSVDHCERSMSEMGQSDFEMQHPIVWNRHPRVSRILQALQRRIGATCRGQHCTLSRNPSRTIHVCKHC